MHWCTYVRLHVNLWVDGRVSFVDPTCNQRKQYDDMTINHNVNVRALLRQAGRKTHGRTRIKFSGKKCAKWDEKLNPYYDTLPLTKP